MLASYILVYVELMWSRFIKIKVKFSGLEFVINYRAHGIESKKW